MAIGHPILLGASAGRPDGSAEILLKAALKSSESAGAQVRIVRMAELRLPSGVDDPDPGDAWWYRERLLEADGEHQVGFVPPFLSGALAGAVSALGAPRSYPTRRRSEISAAMSRSRSSR